MTPHIAFPAPSARPLDVIAASLLTSDEGAAEVHLVARDGRLLRLPTDEATARQLIVSLWQALDRDR